MYFNWVGLGGLTAIHLSLISMTVKLRWTDGIDMSLICMEVRLGWTEGIHLSLICVTVRLGWTDCHTFVSYWYDSTTWMD